jgi:hypothetical protein
MEYLVNNVALTSPACVTLLAVLMSGGRCTANAAVRAGEKTHDAVLRLIKYAAGTGFGYATFWQATLIMEGYGQPSPSPAARKAELLEARTLFDTCAESAELGGHLSQLAGRKADIIEGWLVALHGQAASCTAYQLALHTYRAKLDPLIEAALPVGVLAIVKDFALEGHLCYAAAAKDNVRAEWVTELCARIKPTRAGLQVSEVSE